MAYIPQYYEKLGLPTVGGTEHTRDEAIEAMRAFVYASNVARYGTVYN